MKASELIKQLTDLIISEHEDFDVVINYSCSHRIDGSIEIDYENIEILEFSLKDPEDLRSSVIALA